MRVRFDSLGRKRLGLTEADVQQSLYETPRWRRLLVMAGAAGLTPKLSDMQTIKIGSEKCPR